MGNGVLNKENDKSIQIQLDETDRKIIHYLSEDGRMSFSTLAKKVELSRVMVTRRVAELRKKGVIEKFTIIVPSKYIRKPLPVFFDIQCSPEHVTNAAEKLVAVEDIVIVNQMSGRNALQSETTFLMDGIIIMETLYERDKLFQLHFQPRPCICDRNTSSCFAGYKYVCQDYQVLPTLMPEGS